MKLSSMKQAVVAALEDIKARDIVVLDVRHLTSLFDCMIIASAESTRQTRALANRVQEKLKELGADVSGVEGKQSGEWILIDLGQIVVHVMQPATRQYYNLEELWGQPKPRRKKPSTEPATQEAASTAESGA
jgi:ribosome-associated protein